MLTNNTFIVLIEHPFALAFTGAFLIALVILTSVFSLNAVNLLIHSKKMNQRIVTKIMKPFFNKRAFRMATLYRLNDNKTGSLVYLQLIFYICIWFTIISSFIVIFLYSIFKYSDAVNNLLNIWVLFTCFVILANTASLSLVLRVCYDYEKDFPPCGKIAFCENESDNSKLLIDIDINVSGVQDALIKTILEFNKLNHLVSIESIETTGIPNRIQNNEGDYHSLLDSKQYDELFKKLVIDVIYSQNYIITIHCKIENDKEMLMVLNNNQPWQITIPKSIFTNEYYQACEDALLKNWYFRPSPSLKKYLKNKKHLQ